MSTTSTLFLQQYLEGWRLGLGELCVKSVVPEFYYDDPNSARIYKEGLSEFIEDFKTHVRSINKGQLGEPFLSYADIVIKQDSTPCSAWCWWQATNTDLQGSAFIRFGESGVISEKIAYFSKLPD